MASTTRTPHAFAQESTGWSNLSNVAALDGASASYTDNPGTTTEGPYLAAKDFLPDIPAGDEILGVQVRIFHRCLSNLAVYFAPVNLGPEDHNTLPISRLKVALTKDGSTRVGDHWTVYDDYAGANDVIGGIGYLWGTTWTAAELNADTFGVLVNHYEVGGYDIQGTTHYVDYLEVVVYHQQSGGSEVVSVRETVRQICLLGKEVTPGTGVSASTRLRHVQFELQPNPDFKAHRPQGEKLPAHQLLRREHTEGPFSGIPTFDELGYILASAICAPATSTINTGVYRHEFRLDNRRRDGFQTYTLEYGDLDTRGQKALYGVFNTLALGIAHDDLNMSGQVMARAITDQAGTAMSAGAATVQTLTIANTGTYRLRFRGEETTDLTEASTNTAIQTALRALPSVNSSTQLTVTGTGPFTITFGNSLSGPFKGRPQPIIESRIVSGTVTAGIALTTAGGYTELAGVPITPGMVEVYLATSYASIGSGKLTETTLSNFSMSARSTPRYVLDKTYGDSFKDVIEPRNLDVQMALMMEANSTGMGILANARLNTQYHIRVVATGPLVSGSDYHFLQIDLPVKVAGFGPYQDDQGVYAFDYMFSGDFDSGQGRSLVVTLQNAVASY